MYRKHRRLTLASVALLTAVALLGSSAANAAPAGTPLAGALKGAAPGTTVQLQAGAYTFANFARDGVYGYNLPGSLGELRGAGMDATVLQMDPHSSTKARKVPTKPYTTNQLSLLGVNGRTDLRDFTLRGTAQGHLYNGLRVSRTADTHVTNVRVVAVPGSKNYPPGETFGINDYRTNGSVYRNIEVDGQGVGAAAFGGNNAQNISVTDAYFHGNPHSHGITFWQSKNITLTDVRSENNHGAFNFERDSGRITIIRPVWRNIGNGHAFAFNSDKAGAQVKIYDPVLPAGTDKIRILVAKKYLGKKNRQSRADIHVYQHGRDVTKQLVTFFG